jgi:hypothetical protein
MIEKEKQCIKSYLFFSVVLLGLLIMFYRKLTIPQIICLDKINNSIFTAEKELKQIEAKEVELIEIETRIKNLKDQCLKINNQFPPLEFIEKIPLLMNLKASETHVDIQTITYDQIKINSFEPKILALEMACVSNFDSLSEFIEKIYKLGKPIFLEKINLDIQKKQEYKARLKFRIFLKNEILFNNI